MDELSSFIPEDQQICFWGDQLTACRARTAKKVRVNSRDPLKALRGYVPCASDWHCKVNLIEAS